MKILYKKILLLILILFIFSCSQKEKVSIIKEKDVELQMIESFKEGYKELEDGDVLFAAKKFNEAELLYPQSDWAPKAALMAAYAYYSQDYYFDAIYELQRFIKTYPNHKYISYAHFLLGICYYENIVDEKKDLEPLLNAKQKFEFIIEKYPNTDFALDSEYKLDLIQDFLASKEMYIAYHYIKKKKWIPAINRYKTILKDYETTIFVEEALHRLVELHYNLGLIEESRKYASILGYNYQSSVWYEKSYKVFNKDYKTKLEIKKEKEGIFKKFKGLFD
tara:strand:- start:1863 stop:2696 length:834 start_codon:yes stop_codon:yes gene_type:complete